MFIKGEKYLLQEVRTLLGGGKKGFLPHVGGKIVCGRFARILHPLAPEVIFVWSSQSRDDARTNVYWVQKLEEQNEPIPVFVGVNPIFWEYKGYFRLERVVQDSTELTEYREMVQRDSQEIVMALSFKEVDKPG